jgi:hypothetical protein
MPNEATELCGEGHQTSTYYSCCYVKYDKGYGCPTYTPIELWLLMVAITPYGCFSLIWMVFYSRYGCFRPRTRARVDTSDVNSHFQNERRGDYRDQFRRE